MVFRKAAKTDVLDLNAWSSPAAVARHHQKWAAGCRRSESIWSRPWTWWRERGQVVVIQCTDILLYTQMCLIQGGFSNIPMLFCSDEALKLLKRTRRQSGLILAETHPLQGELADATARAYATMGENNNAGIFTDVLCICITSSTHLEMHWSLRTVWTFFKPPFVATIAV